MCSIANLFGKNMIKFDAKKHFFYPECLNCKSSGKINFFSRTKLVDLRLNFYRKSKASNLRQSKLSASYKENVAAISQSLNVTFLT